MYCPLQTAPFAPSIPGYLPLPDLPMPRGALLNVVTLLAMLHLYMGLRLLPAMGLHTGGIALGILLLVLSTVLVRTGLAASSLQRSRWSDLLAWAGVLAMGFFSSLLVL